MESTTPMNSMVFTIRAALAQMGHEIKSERVTDSISKRRAAGMNLAVPAGRPARVSGSQTRSAMHLVDSGEPAAQAVGHRL